MYYLRAAFLAPGVVLHEFAHHLLCLLTGLRVRKVVYFRLGSPAGFVAHDEPALYRQMLAVTAGPVLINSAVAILLFNRSLHLAARASGLGEVVAIAALVCLAVSVGLQAIPSNMDASNLLHSSTRHLLGGNLAALIGYPIVLVVFAIQSTRPLGSEWFYVLLMASLALRGFLHG